MAKFAFIVWGWKEQIDEEKLNEILSDINEAVRCVSVDTGSSDYVLVIHTPDINLTSEEWNEVLSAGPEFCDLDVAPAQKIYYEVTEPKIKKFLKKLKEDETATQLEHTEQIEELFRLVVESPPNSTPEVITKLDSFTKDELWQEILKNKEVEKFPVWRVKELAAKLGKTLS